MNKTIAVSCVGGRCGSSLLMSLLYHSGVDCGENLRPADQFNPSGYYEVDRIYQAQIKALPWMGKFMPTLPGWKRKKYAPIDDIIRDECKYTPRAVKTPYAVPYDLIRGKRHHLFIKRDHEQQARSIMECNTELVPLEKWMDWIDRWERFIFSEYDFDMIIDFKDLLSSPRSVYDELHKKLELPGSVDPEFIVKPEQPKFNV